MPIALLVGQHREDENGENDQTDDEDDDQFDAEASGRDRQRHPVARSRRVLVVTRTVQVVDHVVERHVLHAAGESAAHRSVLPLQPAAQLLQIRTNSANLNAQKKKKKNFIFFFKFIY